MEKNRLKKEKRCTLVKELVRVKDDGMEGKRRQERKERIIH